MKTRQSTFDRILETVPPTFTGAQLRVFLRALINLDPYTLTDDLAEHFAGEDENLQQTAEDILLAALTETPDEKLTSFALRTVLTGYVAIPSEGEIDLLAAAAAAAAAAFVPPQTPKEKKAKKVPTPIKTASKKTVAKKKIAA